MVNDGGWHSASHNSKNNISKQSPPIAYDNLSSYLLIEPMLLIKKLKIVVGIFRLKIGTSFHCIISEMKYQFTNEKCLLQFSIL